MMAGTLSYPCGMEISAFEHHVGGSVISTATLSAEDSGDTHGLLGVAYTEVVESEYMLLTIESDKLSAFGLCSHHNLMSSHLVGIKAVHRLTIGHHYIIGDIDNIVNRTQSDNLQLVLQPFRTQTHLGSPDRSGRNYRCRRKPLL